MMSEYCARQAAGAVGVAVTVAVVAAVAAGNVAVARICSRNIDKRLLTLEYTYGSCRLCLS